MMASMVKWPPLQNLYRFVRVALGGGCEIGSSVADGSAVALMAGLVWLGMRRRSSNR